MKINHENECINCHKVYNINVNKKGSCVGGLEHNPKY